MKKEELIKKYPDLLKQIFNEFTNESFDKGITWNEYLKENKPKIKNDFLVLGLRNKDNGNYYYNRGNQFINPNHERTKIPYGYGIEKYEITKVKHKEKEYTINDFVLVNGVCYMIKSFTINNDILICELAGCDITIKKPIFDLNLINKTPDFQVKCVKIPHYSELWLSDKTNHFCGIDGKNVIEYEKALLIGEIKSVVYKNVQYSINDVVDYNDKLYEIKSFDKEKVNLKERNRNYYYEPHISEISRLKYLGVTEDNNPVYYKDLVHWISYNEGLKEWYYEGKCPVFVFPKTCKIFYSKDNALKFIEENNKKVLCKKRICKAYLTLNLHVS